MCFVAGGSIYPEQDFSSVAAGTGGSILLVACFGIITPAALRSQLNEQLISANVTLNQSLAEFENATVIAQQLNYAQTTSVASKILLLSRGIAIVLLVTYVLYLTFQLGTHKKLFEEGEESEEEKPKVLIWVAILSLAAATGLVGACSYFLVGSIEGIIQAWGLTETFTGLILLPIVGNAAEHLTAVTVAYKDKMDLSIGVALGSSIQIAMFVTPLMVIIGWIIGQPMTLYFDSFETVVMFLSVVVVNALISDGHSNWIEGAMLLGLYVIIAIACCIVD